MKLASDGVTQSNPEAVYAALEAQMLTYNDYINVPVKPVNAPLVALRESRTMAAYQLRKEMLPVTGEDIYVRSTVAAMLGAASVRLNSEMPGVRLQVGYGYRSLEIQARNFSRQRELLRGSVPDEKLDEAAHRYVARPDIAGHPTGGGVDVRLLRGEEPIDMGTKMWNFCKDSYTFSPFISRRARDNRLRLRAAMMMVGFAPFDGEWWHFSYGDKEWAAYYGRPAALFEQIEFSTITTPEV